ncbi:hypothetical protein FRC07_011108 [Ceratobasidium sp. 392]|nr:hypothetical protein FRC07_011108 [Ceratobasidium sp. 392]
MTADRVDLEEEEKIGVEAMETGRIDEREETLVLVSAVDPTEVEMVGDEAEAVDKTMGTIGTSLIIILASCLRRFVSSLKQLDSTPQFLIRKTKDTTL